MFREFLRVPPAAIATAADLGTWVRLYVCAAEIEKAGRLPGAVDWADRQWLAFAQVTRAEVAGAIAAALVVTDDRDMVVVGYDHDGEKRVQQVRENGRRPTADGKRRGRPPKTNPKPGAKPGENQMDNQGQTGEKAERNPSSSSVSGSDSSPDTDSDPKSAGGGGDPPAAAPDGSLSGVKAVISQIAPLWEAKYCTPLAVSRHDRRTLGMMLKAWEEAGIDLSGIADWYRAFLADDRPQYERDRHRLGRFLEDYDQFRISKTPQAVQREQWELAHRLERDFPHAWALYSADRQRWKERLELACATSKVPDAWEERFAAVEQALQRAA